MEIIGRRWNGLILQALGEGCTTFTEVARYVEGLSDAVLARRLRELEGDALIERTVTDARPPGVRYTLTAAGAALTPILDQITTWGERFVPEAAGVPAPSARQTEEKE